jgi:hypothetical protein
MLVKIVSVTAGALVVGLMLLAASLRHGSARQEGELEVAGRDATDSRRPVPGSRPAPPRLVPSSGRAEPGDQRISHLRGRVYPPAGSNGASVLSALRVVADDGQRLYPVYVDAQGVFDLHLPASTLAITALSPGFIALREGVRTVAGTTQEVDLELQPAASLAGTMQLPRPAANNDTFPIIVRRTGALTPAAHGWTEPSGRFLIPNLVAGRAYDIEVQAPGFRKRIVRAVQAPATGLSIALAPAPRLRGAVGVAPGAACPVKIVTIRAGGDGRHAQIDPQCGFRFDDLPLVPELEVEASARGWFLSATVQVPENGDPEPVCLNPPCQPFGPDILTALEVAFSGVPRSQAMEIDVITDQGGGCHGNGTGCELLAVPVGIPVQLHATINGCQPESQAITPHAGGNHVTFPCRRVRTVEGTIRLADGSAPHGEIEVRCPDSAEAESQLLSDGPFNFELECPWEAAAVEYRPQGDGPWRSARLSSGNADALVEIVLP